MKAFHISSLSVAPPSTPEKPSEQPASSSQDNQNFSSSPALGTATITLAPATTATTSTTQNSSNPTQTTTQTSQTSSTPAFSTQLTLETPTSVLPTTITSLNPSSITSTPNSIIPNLGLDPSSVTSPNSVTPPNVGSSPSDGGSGIAPPSSSGGVPDVGGIASPSSFSS